MNALICGFLTILGTLVLICVALVVIAIAISFKVTDAIRRERYSEKEKRNEGI
jgi:uncharacterized membrane protein YphA (DoxX/SURF4 family)